MGEYIADDEKQTEIQSICTSAQQEVLDAIPQAWRIDVEHFKKDTDSRGVPAQCGVLTPDQLAITELNASELLAEIHAGKLTAVEVTEAFCKRTAIAHQMVNCLISFFPEEAIEAAKVLDDHFKKTGQLVGPFHGLPLAVKDMYDLKGKECTFGYIKWRGRISTEDASLVKVMKEAGVVIIGKTTMPQTGMALETWSNLWGRTLNPYNSKFGSGGSSGGDGALVRMRGVPCSPLSSDIGGSIRAPAAFNGLYGMRPTAARIPTRGVKSTAPGQVSIKVSCGPCCHSMKDLKMITKMNLTHPAVPYEPTCIPAYWNEVATPSRKLRIGILSTDGIVDPHPPVKRALLETADKLRKAGHEVFEFKPPEDLWEVAKTTWALYFQTGAAEIKATMAATGESVMPTFQHNLDVFKTRELSVPELFRHNTAMAEYKFSFSEAWTAAQMDLLITPCAPAAGIPHDFPVWWGYTTLWNILDYPSIIMPTDLKIDKVNDAKVTDYQPRDNPFDRANWEICESSWSFPRW